MTKKQEDKLRAESFRLGKRIAALRFAIAHAGEKPPRAGAPKQALSKERKSELQARIDGLEAERAKLHAGLEKGKKEEGAPASSAPEGTIGDDFSEARGWKKEKP